MDFEVHELIGNTHLEVGPGGNGEAPRHALEAYVGTWVLSGVYTKRKGAAPGSACAPRNEVATLVYAGMRESTGKASAPASLALH